MTDPDPSTASKSTAARNVALLIETSSGYGRGLLEGIVQYVNRHKSWSIALPEQERGAARSDWLSRWKGDGIIARIETQDLADAVQQTKRPVVDVSGALQLSDVPLVKTDDQAVAGLAAEHLLDLGFSRLAYCGDPGYFWSRSREARFTELARNVGCECVVHQSIPVTQKGYSWIEERTRLAKWLRQLPRPTGIMACNDLKALQLLDVCRELSIAVPEEITIVGVDNDRLVCDLSVPSLSSVTADTRRSGYLAAEILQSLMSGDTVSLEDRLVAPFGLQVRESSNTLAIDDPDIAKAVQFIRKHATRGIDVSDVLEIVPLSRAVLEGQFRRILHRSPHQEIMNVRINRVKQLLVNTRDTVAEIAEQTGFSRVEYLSVAFRREAGLTPREFRRNHSPLRYDNELANTVIAGSLQ